MDMSGPMPSSAWVEIRDADGDLLALISAEIEGGRISAELPAFPPGTYGTIQLFEDYGGSIEKEDAKLEELPTSPLLMIAQIG